MIATLLIAKSPYPSIRAFASLFPVEAGGAIKPESFFNRERSENSENTTIREGGLFREAAPEKPATLRRTKSEFSRSFASFAVKKLQILGDFPQGDQARELF